MKKLICLLFAIFIAVHSLWAQYATEAELPVIPRPAVLERHTGGYVFGKETTVFLAPSKDDRLKTVCHDFVKRFSAATGLKFTFTKKEHSADVNVYLSDDMAAEAYTLKVSRQGIRIDAGGAAGAFYAFQTIQQLLPTFHLAAEAKANLSSQQWMLPAVCIQDEPRFGWRGFMLDEGRHFFGKEEIKRVLDMMATYKMNRFHWHLTEDQGWRFFVPAYPRLTEVGAWRESKVLPWGDVKSDGIHYGGYYTDKDIREIVAYARERFIEIMPEVDIPGHSQAAVAAYPEFLACDPENPHSVWVGQGISTDVINVANPKAVQWAKDVVDHLIKLFPFGYIHLGGDECPTTKWERNTLCQQRLKELGSTNYRDLQIDFYRQLQEHINAKPEAERRRLVMWNEVLHGNTSTLANDSITIMAWIGANKAALDAAQRGMETILSPQIPYYINRKQSTLPTEPLSQGHGHETMQAVYQYQPAHQVPDSLLSYYTGVQANFWTEWVEEDSVLEYLMLPRLAAVAEAGWTPQSRREWPNFQQRIRAHAPLYQLRGWNYGKHLWDGNK